MLWILEIGFGKDLGSRSHYSFSVGVGVAEVVGVMFRL
jgi:hypothetical protein